MFNDADELTAKPTGMAAPALLWYKMTLQGQVGNWILNIRAQNMQCSVGKRFF